MDAKCKFVTSWWNGDSVPHPNTMPKRSPAFIQPLGIKLQKCIPKKPSITASFLPTKKVVIPLNATKSL